MADKSTKMLLIVAIALMGLSLLRSGLTSPAQAQSAGQSAPAIVPPPPVMVVDNSTLYVLSNNKIYVYYWDSPSMAKLKPMIGKLRLMQTLDAKTGL